MAREKTAKERELEWQEKYGHMNSYDLSRAVVGGIGKHREEAEARADAAEAQRRDEYNLPYGELVTAVASTRKRVSELEGEPKRLREAKRLQLSNSFDRLALNDRAPSNNKELWINEQLSKYMGDSGSDYSKAKQELSEARNDLAIFLAKKEQKEEELADVIEAERYRSRRAELLSADPDALRALGIVIPVITPEGEEIPVTGCYTDSTIQKDYVLKTFMESRGYGKE